MSQVMIENETVRKAILHLVIEEYIKTVHLVNVTFLADNLDRHLTIQSIMEGIQELEQRGQILFHGFEGGIAPTTKGYVSYKDNLINENA